MSYRFMRILVFFDLPVSTSNERKAYRDFRKYLIKRGFLMLQESVYCKLVLNTTSAKLLIDQVKSNKPKEGLVQLLTVTEKQFSRMETIVGTSNSAVLDSTDRLVVL